MIYKGSYVEDIPSGRTGIIHKMYRDDPSPEYQLLVSGFGLEEYVLIDVGDGNLLVSRIPDLREINHN
jgi:hypothetical protein